MNRLLFIIFSICLFQVLKAQESDFLKVEQIYLMKMEEQNDLELMKEVEPNFNPQEVIRELTDDHKPIFIKYNNPEDIQEILDRQESENSGQKQSDQSQNDDQKEYIDPSIKVDQAFLKRTEDKMKQLSDDTQNNLIKLSSEVYIVDQEEKQKEQQILESENNKQQQRKDDDPLVINFIQIEKVDTQKSKLNIEKFQAQLQINKNLEHVQQNNFSSDQVKAQNDPQNIEQNSPSQIENLQLAQQSDNIESEAFKLMNSFNMQNIFNAENMESQLLNNDNTPYFPSVKDKVQQKSTASPSDIPSESKQIQMDIVSVDTKKKEDVQMKSEVKISDGNLQDQQTLNKINKQQQVTESQIPLNTEDKHEEQNQTSLNSQKQPESDNQMQKNIDRIISQLKQEETSYKDDRNDIRLKQNLQNVIGDLKKEQIYQQNFDQNTQEKNQDLFQELKLEFQDLKEEIKGKYNEVISQNKLSTKPVLPISKDINEFNVQEDDNYDFPQFEPFVDSKKTQSEIVIQEVLGEDVKDLDARKQADEDERLKMILEGQLKVQQEQLESLQKTIENDREYSQIDNETKKNQYFGGNIQDDNVVKNLEINSNEEKKTQSKDDQKQQDYLQAQRDYNELKLEKIQQKKVEIQNQLEQKQQYQKKKITLGTNSHQASLIDRDSEKQYKMESQFVQWLGTQAKKYKSSVSFIQIVNQIRKPITQDDPIQLGSEGLFIFLIYFLEEPNIPLANQKFLANL